MFQDSYDSSELYNMVFNGLNKYLEGVSLGIGKVQINIIFEEWIHLFNYHYGLKTGVKADPSKLVYIFN